jgi:hypothetical protein
MSVEMRSLASMGVTGRHPGKPTGPVVLPGAAQAVRNGEGSQAAQSIRPLASVNGAGT